MVALLNKILRMPSISGIKQSLTVALVHTIRMELLRLTSMVSLMICVFYFLMLKDIGQKSLQQSYGLMLSNVWKIERIRCLLV